MMEKFMAKNVFVNEDVDYDVELVTTIMKDANAGIDHIMVEAMHHDGTVHIVDTDMGVASVVAARLNMEYQDFVEKQATNMKGVGQMVRDNAGAKVMYENDGRQVPVSGSAEDQALSNISSEAKNTVNTAVQTKTTKGDVTMTSTNKTMTTEELSKSKQVEAFLNREGGRIQDAKKAPAQKEAPVNKKEETKGKNVTVKQEKKASATQTTKKDVTAMKKTLKGGVNVKQGTEENVATEGKKMKSAGSIRGTKKLSPKKLKEQQSKKNRLAFDESFQAFAGPWFLNKDFYPAVERIEDLIAERKDEDLGITDIKFLDADAELRYDNHDVLAIVRVIMDDKGYSFKIKEEKNEKKKPNIRSSSITWNGDDKNLRPLHTVYKKNDDQDLSITCGCGNRSILALDNSVECTCGATITNEVDADSNVSVSAQKVDKDGLLASVLAGEGKDPASFVEEVEIKDFSIQDYLPLTNPEVSKDVIAMAMAFAQYGLGEDMFGLIEE